MPHSGGAHPSLVFVPRGRAGPPRRRLERPEYFDCLIGERLQPAAGNFRFRAIQSRVLLAAEMFSPSIGEQRQYAVVSQRVPSVSSACTRYWRAKSGCDENPLSIADALRVARPFPSVEGDAPAQVNLGSATRCRTGTGSGESEPAGGAVALGHPIGATGAILTVKALYELERTQKRYALVTMCIGGGQGIAAIFERN